MTKLIFFFLGVLLGVLLGFSIFRLTLLKPDGKVLFFLQAYDNEVDVVQCSLKPNMDWYNYMNHRRIIFSISRSPEVEEALKRNNIKKEN